MEAQRDIGMRGVEMKTWGIVLMAVLLWACEEEDEGWYEAEQESESGGDGDPDTDTDTDSDGDSDMGEDTEGSEVGESACEGSRRVRGIRCCTAMRGSG